MLPYFGTTKARKVMKVTVTYRVAIVLLRGYPTQQKMMQPKNNDYSCIWANTARVKTVFSAGP